MGAFFVLLHEHGFQDMQGGRGEHGAQFEARLAEQRAEISLGALTPAGRKHEHLQVHARH
jgi:hypothetical protein